MSIDDHNEKISRPKKPRFIRVVDENGKPVPRAHKARAKDFDAIAVLVVDRNDRVLRSLEWDVARIERMLDQAAAKGASDVSLARGLGEVGEDAGALVNREIRDALLRRSEARKKSK